MKASIFLGLFFISVVLPGQDRASKEYVGKIIETIEVNPDSALALAIKLQKESNSQYEKVQSYFIAGWIYNDVFTTYDSAVINYLRAFEYAKESDYAESHKNMISLLKNCGVIARKAGYYLVALEFYEKGLEIAKRYNEIYQVVSLNYNIAGIYGDLEKYEKGIDLLNSNIEHHYLDKRIYLENLARKTHFLLKTDEIDSAMLICEGALTNDFNLTPKTKLVFKHNLAIALANKGDLSKSTSLVLGTVEELVGHVSFLKLAALFEDYASILAEQGHYELAESMLKKSLIHLNRSRSEEERYTSEARDIYLNLANVSFLLGKTSEANYYSELYEKELHAYNQLHQRYNMNLLLDKFYSDYEKKKQSEFFSKLIKWILAASFFLILTAFSFNRYRSYKSKKLIERNEISRKMAELKALKAQINPHFLFNSLNSVHSFILEGENETAEEYLVKYSQLMRKILNHSSELTVSISEEIDILELYVSLEKVRLGFSFDFVVKIDDDIDPDNTNIPSMIIQPFIENAIWHGMSEIDYKGFVELSFAKSEGGEIKVSILDNGPGLDDDSYKKRGKGPRGEQLVRERLKLLNHTKNNASDVLEIRNREEGGTSVELKFKTLT